MKQCRNLILTFAFSDTGNDEQTFVVTNVGVFLDVFKGNEDYVNSRIYQLRTTGHSFNKSTVGTVIVDFVDKECKNKVATTEDIINAIVDMFKSPEFKGMIFD